MAGAGWSGSWAPHMITWSRHSIVGGILSSTLIVPQQLLPVVGSVTVTVRVSPMALLSIVTPPKPEP